MLAEFLVCPPGSDISTVIGKGSVSYRQFFRESSATPKLRQRAYMIFFFFFKSFSLKVE